MLDCEIEHDAPADRAAHHDRLVQFHGLAEGADRRRVGLCSQAIFAALPAVRRGRLAVPRHVEGQHAEAPGDLGVGQQVTVLAIVGAGGVKADEGDAFSGLLEIEAMGNAFDLGPQIAADHRIELGRHVDQILQNVGLTGRGHAFCLARARMSHPRSRTRPTPTRYRKRSMKKRDFLKLSSAATAGLAFGGLPSPGARAQSTAGTLRVAMTAGDIPLTTGQPSQGGGRRSLHGHYRLRRADALGPVEKATSPPWSFPTWPKAGRSRKRTRRSGRSSSGRAFASTTVRNSMPMPSSGTSTSS